MVFKLVIIFLVILSSAETDSSFPANPLTLLSMLSPNCCSKYAFPDLLVKIFNVYSFLSNVVQTPQYVITGPNFTKPHSEHHNSKPWVHLYGELCHPITHTDRSILFFSIDPTKALLQLKHGLCKYNFIQFNSHHLFFHVLSEDSFSISSSLVLEDQTGPLYAHFRGIQKLRWELNSFFFTWKQ